MYLGLTVGINKLRKKEKNTKPKKRLFDGVNSNMRTVSVWKIVLNGGGFGLEWLTSNKSKEKQEFGIICIMF